VLVQQLALQTREERLGDGVDAPIDRQVDLRGRREGWRRCR
jgi:hypothetical protein